MAFFGLIKKKKKNKIVSKQERNFLKLNNQRYPRYFVEQLHTSYGDVIDISKNSLLVNSEKLSVGDEVVLRIEGKSYNAEVVRVLGKRVAFKLNDTLPKEIIDKYEKKIETLKIIPKRTISIQELASVDEVNRVKAIINLMLEIEDPNTNIAKFKENIEILKDLKKKILDMANSVEISGRGYVYDIGTAISRLGFDTVKKVVYNYINYEVSWTKHQLENFKDFDLFTIFLNAVFKRLAPLFNFHDVRSEGQSLLTMSTIGAFVLSQESRALLEVYTSPKELFSCEARCYEYRECGKDLLEVNKEYFIEILDVFHYLYDGFVLANFILYPHYMPFNLRVKLSQRKLRYAYVVYMSILAQYYLFRNDRQSGYIFFQRLERFGFKNSDGEKWFYECISNINKKLREVGLEKTIKTPLAPSRGIAIERYFGGGVYVNYFLSKVDQFDREGERLAIRFEDQGLTHIIIEKMINADRFSFLKMAFCVIPCDRLEDDEIPLTTFDGFDLLIFQNIDSLSPSLYKDFAHIWKEFDGKIIVTFNKSSKIEYRAIELFELIREQIVDFPSIDHAQHMQFKIMQQECEIMNSFFHKNVCNLEELKGDRLDFYGLVAKVLDKL